MTGTVRPDPPAPTPAALFAARAQLHGIARRTPLQHSSWLSELTGVPVHLKLECWQRTGSFKLRGAFNAIARLDPDARERGLVTASAGNHGLAVAVAASLHGARATIFVPENAPDTKKRRIRRAGAELREVPGSYDNAAEAARTHTAEAGAHFVHAFNDAAVLAGQGTVGLEIVEELPGVAEVVVPVGGGGLAGGVGAAVRALAPDARTWGVQSSATSAMYDAFQAGGLVPVHDAPTLCDGLAGETEEASYRCARAVLHGMEQVDEASVGPAIRELFREEAVGAEGAGVVGVAALLAGILPLRGPTAVVVSGGNIDGDRLARILREDPWQS